MQPIVDVGVKMQDLSSPVSIIMVLTKTTEFPLRECI